MPVAQGLICLLLAILAQTWAIAAIAMHPHMYEWPAIARAEAGEQFVCDLCACKADQYILGGIISSSMKLHMVPANQCAIAEQLVENTH